MTAASDLATAKTQADTTKTATGTLLTNCISARTSEYAAPSSYHAQAAVALAYQLDQLAARIVWELDASRTTYPGA